MACLYGRRWESEVGTRYTPPFVIFLSCPFRASARRHRPLGLAVSCTRPTPLIYTSYRMVYSNNSQWSIHPSFLDYYFIIIHYFGKWSPSYVHTLYSGGRFDHLWIRGDPVSGSSGTAELGMVLAELRNWVWAVA